MANLLLGLLDESFLCLCVGLGDSAHNKDIPLHLAIEHYELSQLDHFCWGFL